MACHELFSFVDAYSLYNHIKMHLDDQDKMTIIVDRGLYYYKNDAIKVEECRYNL